MKWQGQIVPNHWQIMLPRQILQSKAPPASRPDCSKCPMDDIGDPRNYARCCTFYPEMPQFTLTEAYLERPEDDVWESLVTRRLLLPEGLIPSPYRLQRIGSGPCDFFHRQTGQCGVYLQRNPICSGWFCRSSSANQEAYWSAIKHYIGHCETVIRQWLLEEIGFDLESYVQCFDELAAQVTKISDLQTEGWRRDIYETLWQGYIGHEWELMCRAYEHYKDNIQNLDKVLKSRKIRYSKSFTTALRTMLGPHYRGVEIVSYENYFDLTTAMNKAQKCLEQENGALQGEPNSVVNRVLQTSI